MFPLLGFRKYILLSQGCSEGDPAAIGRGCSSNKVNGPSLRDVKSGMQTVRGSNERQWSSESVVAGTTQDNKRKTIRWRDGYHPEENCSYLTQQFPFHFVWYKCRVSAMQCDKSFFWETLFLEVRSSFYVSLSPSFLSATPCLPPGRDMFLSAASAPVTLLHGGSQSGRSPLSSSILFASKIVCTWKMWSCVAPSCRRRWNSVESLMHTNLCRWCSYCWKMDCLIKHIIRHICCLASQIEVVFCTNFLVKFVNVHVIFALGHRARCKFLASLLVASQFWLFLTMKWISLRIRHSLYEEERKTAGSG